MQVSRRDDTTWNEEKEKKLVLLIVRFLMKLEPFISGIWIKVRSIEKGSLGHLLGISDAEQLDRFLAFDKNRTGMGLPDDSSVSTRP